MSPGPATAATLAAGVQQRHAGLWIALGHAVVELPIILLVVLGAETFKAGWFKTGMGIAGGALLLLLAKKTIAGLGREVKQENDPKPARPFWTGIVVTGANPYFLLWWATVGLAIATAAAELGALAFILFIVLHWLCDLFWLEVLSQASYRGVALLGRHGQDAIVILSACMMAAFGAWFLYDAARAMLA